MTERDKLRLRAEAGLAQSPKRTAPRSADEAQQTLADQLIDNIDNFVAGHPTNLVEGAF